MIDKSFLSVSLDQAPETWCIYRTYSVLLPCRRFEMNLSLIKSLHYLRSLFQGVFFGVKSEISIPLLPKLKWSHAWNMGNIHDLVLSEVLPPSLHQAWVLVLLPKKRNIRRPRLSQRARLWRLTKHSARDCMSLAVGLKARTMCNLFKKLNVMTNNGRRFAQYFFTAKYFRLPQKKERKNKVKFHIKVFSFVEHVLKFGRGMHLNQGRVTFR